MSKKLKRRTKKVKTSTLSDTPRVLLVAIVMFIAGSLIYSNIFRSPFQFDDIPNIGVNYTIRNINHLGLIWNFWPTRFVTYLSFAVNYHLHQLHVPGYHLVNLIVHVGCAILVWWLVTLTFQTPAMKGAGIAKHAKPIAFFSGLIFLTHPVQTEAVTYIVQRATSLAAFFCLASLSLYVTSRISTDKKHASVFYWCSLLCAVTAMFTKEMAVILPFTILLYESFFLQEKRNFRWKPLIPFLATLAVIPLTMYFSKSVNFREMRRIAEPLINITPHHYLFTQFRVIVTYLRLLFIPLNQNFDYDYHIAKSLWQPSVLGSLLFLLFILGAGVLLFRKGYRMISFGIFWFFLTLLPESSFIPIKDVIFEHRLYLPIAGYSIFLVTGLYYFAKKINVRIITAILLIVSVLYGTLTYARNVTWKDELTLWNDTVHKSPNKARPYNNRGMLYAQNGNYDQAISDCTKAIELDPNYAAAYNNRGAAYGNKGSYDQAISDCTKAIELDPNYAAAYNNRGKTYGNKGNYDQAISDCTKAIELEPNYTAAYYNRGNAYGNKGNYDQAISDYTKAIEINPNYETYNNRGFAYYYKKEYDKAWADVHKAEKLGYIANSKFLDALKKASGRGK